MSRPPHALRLLARLLIPARNREFVLGDLEEMYAHRATRRGKVVAALRFSLDTILSAWSGLVSRVHPSPEPNAGGPGPRRTILRGGGSGLLGDLFMAFRSLRREAPLVALAVLTLGLGVGTAAAVFGMVDQILLRPLAGVGNPEDAAYLQFYSVDAPERTQGRGIATLDFDDLRASATLLQGIATFGYTGWKVSRGNERPVSVRGSTVYGDYFETLRVRPVAGRLLTAGETRLGSDPLRAVLSERLARDLFGSAVAGVGETLQVNGEAVTVIGIAGGGFAGAERRTDVEMWLPYGALVPLNGFDLDRLLDRNSVMHGDIVVRARPDVTEEAVLDQVDAIRRRLSTADNESGPYLADLRPRLFQGLHVGPQVRARTYASLRIMGIVVGVVLLLTCANVANLLLFRNERRRGMFATLRALGASTGRIARQQLVLSILISVLGTIVGIGVGWLVAQPFEGARLSGMQPFEGLLLDRRVLLFGAAASATTAILFGALPAVLAGRFNLIASLRRSSGRDTGRGGALRSVLSTIQFAGSMALVVAALLLIRTLDNLYSVDFGLDAADIVMMQVDMPRDIDVVERDLLYRNLITAVEALPEVSGAAIDPYGPNSMGSFIGRIRLPDTPADEVIQLSLVTITPGWLDVVGADVIAGRSFKINDWDVEAPTPVLLTESLARRLFGHTEVVGRRVSAGFAGQTPSQVIGVVADIRTPTSPSEPVDMVFMTPGSFPWTLPTTTLSMRIPSYDQQVGASVRSVVEGVLPNEPVPDPIPMSARLDRIHSETRVYSRLLTYLSVLAVVLSAVGLYGVIAFNVTARRREFGIRLALGAEGRRIVRLVARNAAGIVTAGTVLGVAGAFSLSRLLENRLFGVTPLDPISYGAAALLFLVVVATASWAPTRRTLDVDPVRALREE